jgi:hypothetical protein
VDPAEQTVVDGDDGVPQERKIPTLSEFEVVVVPLTRTEQVEVGHLRRLIAE